MKIRILLNALEDLREGYEFYEKQAEGIGADSWIRCSQISIH